MGEPVDDAPIRQWQAEVTDEDDGRRTMVDVLPAIDVQRRIRRISRKHQHIESEMRGGLASIRRAQKWDRIILALAAMLLFIVALIQTRDRITAREVERLMHEHNERPHEGAVSSERFMRLDRELELVRAVLEAYGSRDTD